MYMWLSTSRAAVAVGCRYSIRQLLSRSISTTGVRKDEPHEKVALSQGIRRVMRGAAQPIAIVSAFVPNENKEPEGIHSTTLSSFTTVSLAPPLVAFSIRQPSRMADALRAGVTIPVDGEKFNPQFSKKPHFLIHILSETQSELSNFFARPGATPYALNGPTDPAHPFNTYPMIPSQSVKGQLVPAEAIGSLACSLVYQLDLSSADLHGTTEFQDGCKITSENGSALFLGQIHAVEQSDITHETDACGTRRPLAYWHQKYCSLVHDP